MERLANSGIAAFSLSLIRAPCSARYGAFTGIVALCTPRGTRAERGTPYVTPLFFCFLRFFVASLALPRLGLILGNQDVVEVYYVYIYRANQFDSKYIYFQAYAN